MVNPRGLYKTMFMNAEELKPCRERAARYLPLVEIKICHLHSLKRIHNDINPADILITEDDIPVFIDFGSSRDPGTDLADVGRTHGWFNANFSKAMESNDFDALKEMRTWLTRSSADDYQFKY
jgi:serine/threonine protein kinase